MRLALTGGRVSGGDWGRLQDRLGPVCPAGLRPIMGLVR